MAPLRLDIALTRRSFELDASLEVGPETVAVVGPSGAGKTSLLQSVAGLVRPDRGRIAVGDEPWFDDQRRIDLPPQRRSVGLVFQEYALFPHMTVRQNVAYGGRGGGRRDRNGRGGRDRVDELLERMRIVPLANARPGELSGGERQRVALARALARDPSVLLFDEPLSALDAHTRAVVRRELAALLVDLALPTMLITHDFRDALALADRVAVVVDGRLQQVGRPAEVAARPSSETVAAITGTPWTTGVARRTTDGRTVVELADGRGELHADEPAAGPVGLVVDPCDVTAQLGPRPDGDGVISGPISEAVVDGGRIRVRVGGLVGELPGAGGATALATPTRAGDTAHLLVPSAAVRLVPLDG